jgi:hypothetical protein
MTLNVAPGGYLLDAGSGEALWFSGGLLTYKTTGDQTSGNLAVAEVRAPQVLQTSLRLKEPRPR